MRIAFVIPSLELGGAERTLAMLANAWAKRDKEVTVIIFNHSEGPSYPLHHNVRLCSLDVPNVRARHLWQAFSTNLQRVRRLRRAIRKGRPDVVISFMDFPNIITLLATRGLRVPLVITEHANPDYVDIGRVWDLLRRLMYRFADMLVCPTSQMAALLQKRVKVTGRGIPNPVELPAGVMQSNEPLRRDTGHVVVGVGRLVPQKGFDLLLEAFSRVAGRHPDWSVTIIGAGPLKDQLEAQSESLGLMQRVTFTGSLADPFPIMRSADLFVFSSRFEGFGNALAEAMACGLPVISFDCTAGPSDIIRHGIDGILVPPEDTGALAAAMDNLMGDPQERATLASRAPEVLARFSLERVLSLWEELFDQIMSKHNDTDRKALQREQEAVSRR